MARGLYYRSSGNSKLEGRSMKTKITLLAIAVIAVAVLSVAALSRAHSKTENAMTAPVANSIYDFTLKDIDGKEASLSQYHGKVLLLVNVASRCGFTPQYEGLEKVYLKYKDRGLIILGFPANNFGAQEPGTNEEIKTFCSLKYSVTFPMFAKISV